MACLYREIRTGLNAHDLESRGDVLDFLLCFDFTRERFGPRLRLPFESYYDDAVTLASVRDEQLAVLFQCWDTYEMEVWVTTKIEPNAVSWSKFLAVDMGPLTGFRFYIGGSFLIDEERRAVVVFDEDKDRAFPTGQTQLSLLHWRKWLLQRNYNRRSGFLHALSYVPSSVQINQPT